MSDQVENACQIISYYISENVSLFISSIHSPQSSSHFGNELLVDNELVNRRAHELIATVQRNIMLHQD